MREYGIPKVLTWRWTPFAALVLGSLSFAAFAMLVIPDRIGHVDGESTAAKLSLGNAFVRPQPGSTPASNWSSSDDQTAVASPSPVARVATRAPDEFPKRGFSPPLEHEAAAATPAPAPPPPPPPDLIPPPAAAPPPAPPPPAQAQPPGPDRPEPPAAPPTDQAAPPATVLPTSQ